MPNHGMTPHTSGTSLSAQFRYAAGVREILECYLEGRPIRDEYLILKDGKLAGTGAHSYSEGGATAGSEEAVKFSKNKWFVYIVNKWAVRDQETRMLFSLSGNDCLTPS